MSSIFRERAEAKALQEALERFDQLLAGGADRPTAVREVSAALSSELRRAFALATALPQRAVAELPEPAFAEAFEARLRGMEVPVAVPSELRGQPRFQGVLAAAAAIVVLAGLLVPALHSLPGDPLYALKSATEGARTLVASGQAEASVRIALANERFREVERLIDRSRMRSMGLGVVAGALEDDLDPEVVGLVRETLAAAEHQLATAAEIITAAPGSADAASIEQLVASSQHGQDIAENVAESVPHADKTPVLKTVVKFARIEAQATAARMTVEAVAPEPTPCVTATPAPTATPDEATPEPVATPDATPAEAPEATPEGTATPSPCVTPTPSPTATPGGDDARTPEPSSAATPAATEAPGANAGVDTGQNPDEQSGTTDALAGQSSG